jgi:phosphoribosyl 1,2-cyclic phosphodiesterase
VEILFCGVRGSTSAPGADFVRVGGHTSCVALAAAGDDVPTLLLDAGTGIRRVTDLLGGAPFRGTIALTHLHWDHVQGLPFFAAGDRPDAEVQLLLPAEPHGPGAVGGGSAAELLGRAMSPPHFPIGPEGLQGRWRFAFHQERTRALEGFTVTTREIAHKGGRTVGFRVERDGAVLAYLPDHRPDADPARRANALELAAGADVLLHDAQFRDDEHVVADLYGHATWDQAVALAAEAGVGELVLFHHAPARTDDALDEMLAALGAPPVPVTLAVEGTTLTL